MHVQAAATEGSGQGNQQLLLIHTIVSSSIHVMGGCCAVLCCAGSSRDAALFAARLLAPHTATYAAVLRAAHSQLSARGREGMRSTALLQSVQADLLAQAAEGQGGHS